MPNYKSPDAFADPEDPQLVADAKKVIQNPVHYTYTEVCNVFRLLYSMAYSLQRDVILYNLGIGATEKDLQWTFEGDDEFGALPTFGVIPQFPATSGVPLDFLPNFNPASIRNTSTLSPTTHCFHRRNCFMVNNT